MKGKANSSEKARLRRLGARAGKPFGSSSMYSKKTYPKKNAGTEREFTIPGGKGRHRPDRMARGGGVKHKPHATTNIIISHAGGRGGSGGGGAGPQMGLPRPPILPPRPIGAGVPPVGAGAMPPMPPPGAGAMPPPVVRPPMPVGPAGPVPVRPPGMKKGGRVAGLIDVKDSPGKGYPGYPHSPTTEVDDAVSARKRGGGVKKARRGGLVRGLADGGETDGGSPPGSAGGEDGVDKMQFGGAFGGGPFGGGAPGGPAPGAGGQNPGGVSSVLGQIPGRTPQRPIQGPPNISGRPMIPAQPVTVPMPATMSSFRAWPAPGTRVGFSKKGGSVNHDDEAEDRKLFSKMMKERKRARGGHVGEIGGSSREGHTVLGAVHSERHTPTPPAKSIPTGHKTVLAGEKYKDWGKSKRKRGGSVRDSVQQSRPHGQAGEIYHQQGVGYRAAGGTVVPSVGRLEGGSGSGMGRIRKMKAAEKIPDKTEL